MTDLTRPRVLVFGAGAVGTLLGGILSGARHDVTLLGRGQSIESIQRDGLEVNLPDQSFRTVPAAVSSIDDLEGRFDIVLLTVRAFAVEEALSALSSLIARAGILVSVQNGIGTEDLIAGRLPDIDHVAGSLTLSADIPKAGMVSTSSRSGGIALAPVSRDAPAGRISEMFGRAGLKVMIHADYRSMKWSKLLLNQMANGIPAILDWTPGQFYRHDRAFRVELAMLRETLQVIESDGGKLVSLPGFPVPLLKWALRLPPGVARRLLLRRVESGRGDKLPSLLLDLHNGRTQLEADWLYGVVADTGAGYGVAAPVNQRVNALLKGIAINQELRKGYRDRPDLLIRNVPLAVNTTRK